MIRLQPFTQKNEGQRDAENRHEVDENAGFVGPDGSHGLVPENVRQDRREQGNIEYRTDRAFVDLESGATGDFP